MYHWCEAWQIFGSCNWKKKSVQTISTGWIFFIHCFRHNCHCWRHMANNIIATYHRQPAECAIPLSPSPISHTHIHIQSVYTLRKAIWRRAYNLKKKKNSVEWLCDLTFLEIACRCVRWIDWYSWMLILIVCVIIISCSFSVKM